MRIHSDFTGGNISVKEVTGNTVVLENELRDTTEDWFYWAFCVEDVQNQSVTFRFQKDRLGYFGPAVSHDLCHWHWLDASDGDSFTYHFAAEESKVYFAHSMLYHPARFLQFAESRGIAVEELCKGYKGGSVPCIRFGDGDVSVILTARHHACESTGNYVLEGVLEDLLAEPIPGTKVLCVPFVDYEGVIRGDQGKSRAPHDHNRDYPRETDSIYPECGAIREYVGENGCHFGFDFHSPWHLTLENDHVFIVQNSVQLAQQKAFSGLLAQSLTEDSLRYDPKNDYPPNLGWNKAGIGTSFASYMCLQPENRLSLTLETTYFGTPDNKVSEGKMLELGRCFAKALRRYIASL